MNKTHKRRKSAGVSKTIIEIYTADYLKLLAVKHNLENHLKKSVSLAEALKLMLRPVKTKKKKS